MCFIEHPSLKIEGNERKPWFNWRVISFDLENASFSEIMRRNCEFHIVFTFEDRLRIPATAAGSTYPLLSIRSIQLSKKCSNSTKILLILIFNAILLLFHAFTLPYFFWFIVKIIKKNSYFWISIRFIVQRAWIL